MLSNIAVKKETMMLKIIAHHQPSTLKPSTRLAHSFMMMALITNKKRPSVIMVIGNVKNIKLALQKSLKAQV